MTTFLLIRHGENDYVKTGRMAGRTPGVHLNERGKQQADALGAALKDVPINALYSSPLDRAQETAAPIASARGLTVELIPDLLDTNIGEWQGKEIKEISKLPEWKTVQGAPSRFRFPGGESFAENQLRLVNVIEALVKKHQPEDVVACVFHADPIKLVTAWYLGMPLDHFQRLGCDTGSVTVWSLGPNHAHLVGANLKPPFDEKFLQPAKAQKKKKS
jgi:probable phosphomutase (TIGR03848 family)